MGAGIVKEGIISARNMTMKYAELLTNLSFQKDYKFNGVIELYDFIRI